MGVGRACLLAVLCSTYAVLLQHVPGVAADSAAPAVVVAQGGSDTHVALIWTAAGGASSYDVYPNGTVIANTSATNCDGGGRTSLTQYQCRVAGVVAGAQVGLPRTAPAVTQAPRDSTPPTEPGAITVSSITQMAAKLTWPKSTDNIKVEGYRVLRGQPGDAPANLPYIWTVDAFKNTYTATALRSGSSYQFGLVALDPDNNLSSIRTVTLTIASSTDATAPTPPSSTSVALRPFSSSRIDLTWGGSASTDVSGYLVLRNGGVVGHVDLPSRTTYSDNGLTAGGAYSYSIEAVGSAGKKSLSPSPENRATPAAGKGRVSEGPVGAMGAGPTWPA